MSLRALGTPKSIAMTLTPAMSTFASIIVRTTARAPASSPSGVTGSVSQTASRPWPARTSSCSALTAFARRALAAVSRSASPSMSKSIVSAV